MTDEEFDLLDELYFIQPYEYLKEELGWDEGKLLLTLQSLHLKEWIKCFSSPDEELFEGCDIIKSGKNYFYLATKRGLMQHNTF